MAICSLPKWWGTVAMSDGSPTSYRLCMDKLINYKWNQRYQIIPKPLNPCVGSDVTPAQKPKLPLPKARLSNHTDVGQDIQSEPPHKERTIGPFYRADRTATRAISHEHNILIMQISSEDSPGFNNLYNLATVWKEISADRHCFAISADG